jgi:phospholipid/cholesterol/gamma-HCH transport system substrate-binding protein
LKISREIKLGITAVTAIAFFIWGFNFLKGKDVFQQEREFYAVYPLVNGLTASNPVFINGIKVGLVKEVGFMEDGSNRILVEFALTNSIPVPSNTIARIYSSDLMGSKAIELVLGNSTTLAKVGDTLKSEVQVSLQEEVNRQVLPLKTKAEALMLSIDSAMTVIRYVFNEKTRENLEMSFLSIKNTIANLESTTGNLDTLMSAQRGKISLIVGNVEAISANLKNNNQKISNILANFSSISDTLARIRISETIEHLNTTLAKTSDIMTKIQSGNGTVGKLIASDSLHKELTESARQLDLLLEDMRLNPKRYVHFSVFGSSPAKYKATPAKEK